MTSLKRQRHVLGVNAAHGNKVSRERIGHEVNIPFPHLES
jgi:hypothetical protein